MAPTGRVKEVAHEETFLAKDFDGRRTMRQDDQADHFFFVF